MSDVIVSVEAVEASRPVELSADLLDDQLIGQLVDRARAGGLQLTGEGWPRRPRLPHLFPYVPGPSGYGKRLRAASCLLTSLIRIPP